MDTAANVNRLAAGQHGLITYVQGRLSGLSLGEMRTRRARGEWLHVFRGVYRVAGAPETWRQRALAACLAGPAGATASHLTAAALLGLVDAPPSVPHVTVPPTSSSRLPLAFVHRSPLDQRERHIVDGIPCTAVSRTLVDCAGVVSARQLEGLVDAAFCEHRSTPEAIARAVARVSRKPGRAGTAAVLRAIEVWRAGIAPESPAEMRLVRLLLAWGFEGVVRQCEVRDTDGTFVARLDLAWPERRIGLEYDSPRWHSDRHWVRDEARDQRLGAMGWRIEHAGPPDLRPGSTRLRARLEGLFKCAA
jgi:hypothetical protein